MTISHSLGMFVGRNKLAYAAIAAIALVFIPMACTKSKAVEEKAPAQSQEEVRKASEANADAIRVRCTNEMPTLLAEAKAALARNAPYGAQGILASCLPYATDTETKEFSKKLTLQIESLEKLKTQAAKVETARIDKADKLRKKNAGVSIGMSKQDVLDSSWGKPTHINTTTTSRSVREQWVYGGRNYLYFTDGVLTSIQN